jgi:nitrate/nitrite-specific signal transduction histidine kinase
MDKKGDSEIERKADEFLQIFKKGEEFTQQLLKENERLRYKILELSEQKRTVQRGGNDETLTKLAEALKQLEEEKRALLSRFKEVEEENKDFAERYVEVEEENNNLANLYVASYQLHSTLDFKEVLRIVVEIIINLVGSDRFAVMLLDESATELSVVASEGIDDKRFKRMKVEDGGIIGTAARTGESYYETDLENFTPISDYHPIVCIPLKVNNRVIGIIAIFGLMEQKKKKLSRVDFELFSMLAGHAATAIFSSKLYSQSERKLSTIQGFIDLLSGRIKS